MSGLRRLSDRSLDAGRRWYVVHTQPNRESRAATHLRNQGFRVFLPMHCKTIRHARQFRTVNAPFFPRYLFVHFAIGRDRWRSVRGTYGVSSLIMEGDQPKPIATELVEELMANAEPSGIIAIHGRLRLGDAVRIATGPFSGVVGRLAAIGEDGRVKVLLEAMGAHVAVTAAHVGLLPIT